MSTKQGLGAHVSGVILFKKAAQKIPNAYLETALKHNPSFYGLLYRQNNTLKIESGDSPTVEDINGLLEIVADQDVFLHLGYDPNGRVIDRNIQPFSTLVEKTGSLFVSLLAGDFSQFRNEKNTELSAEASFNEEILQPWLNDMLIEGKQDVDTVHELLKQNYVKTLMHCLIPENGTIVILNKNGKMNRFSTGEDFQKFNWGWTSNKYDYVETAAEAPETPAEQPVTPTPSAPIPNEQIKEATDTPVTAPSDVDLLQGGSKLFREGKWWVSPPAESKGWNNNQIRSWYNTVAGHVPKAKVWKNREAVPVPLLAQSKFGPAPGTEAVDTTTKKTETATVTPISVANKPAVTAPAVEKKTEVVHSHNNVTAKDKAALKTLIVDKSSQRMPSPEYLAELQKKVPTFVEMVGIQGLEDTFSLSFEALVKLGQTDVNALARLAFDRGVAYYNLLAENVTIEEDATEKEETPVKTATPPAPVAPQQKKKGISFAPARAA